MRKSISQYIRLTQLPRQYPFQVDGTSVLLANDMCQTLCKYSVRIAHAFYFVLLAPHSLKRLKEAISGWLVKIKKKHDPKKMVKLSRYSSYMYLIKRSYSFMYEIRKIICNIMVEGVSLLFTYNNIYWFNSMHFH